jgi:hypothetical protein
MAKFMEKEPGNICLHGEDPYNPTKACKEPTYIHYDGKPYCKKHFSERYNHLMAEKSHMVGHHKYLEGETQRMADAERRLLRTFEEVLLRQSQSDIVIVFEQVDRELRQQLPNYSLTERMRQIFMDREEQKKQNMASVHPDEFGGSDY